MMAQTFYQMIHQIAVSEVQSYPHLCARNRSEAPRITPEDVSVALAMLSHQLFPQ